MQGLKIQELQQQAISLHRDIANMMSLLGYKPEAADKIMLGTNVPLFPAKMGSRAYLGDTAMLGNITSYFNVHLFIVNLQVTVYTISYRVKKWILFLQVLYLFNELMFYQKNVIRLEKDVSNTVWKLILRN